jgi:alpha-L-rhamnosidase
MKSTCFLLILFFALQLVVPMNGQELLVSEFVFDDAPFPSCHASTIVDTEAGLVVAWFGGTHEKHADVGIWMARKLDGRWTPPREIVNGIQHQDKRYPCWNPVLYKQPDGTLMLFYKVGPSPSEWWGMTTISNDNGASWSQPRRLPEDIIGPVKNKPLLLDNGVLICPSSTEHDGWKIHLELTSDFGKSWERVGPLAGRGIDAIQPSILKHGDRLQILCRSKRSGIVEAWSDDQGLSWTELQSTGLPNPNSGTDAITSGNGKHYLVYNPTSTPEGEWGGERFPLVLADSEDGETWDTILILEDQPGEYSYPAIIEDDQGNLQITYTWKRDKIKHLVYQP